MPFKLLCAHSVIGCGSISSPERRNYETNLLRKEIGSSIIMLCFVAQLLDNQNGELCSHYPSQLVVLEYVHSEDSLQGK